METGYAKLKPLGLAIAFAAAAVVEIILIFLPMGVMHRGMMQSGAGMMGYGSGMMGSGMGGGAGLLIAVWIIIVSAIVGAVVAAVYNALLATKQSSP